jgi:hypothetical protein
MNESKHGFYINEKKMERKRIEQQQEAQTTQQESNNWFNTPMPTNSYSYTWPAAAIPPSYHPQQQQQQQQPALPSIHHACPYQLSHPYNP